MAAPWEMTYGPYWQQEIRRREASRRALGMPTVSPAQEAAEWYGIEEARLKEKRALTQQNMENYYKNEQLEMMKDAQKQKMLSDTVTGVGSLALGGYKAGKELGIWGKPAEAIGSQGGGAEAGITQATTSAMEPVTWGSPEWAGNLGVGGAGGFGPSTGAEAALTSQLSYGATSGAGEGILGLTGAVSGATEGVSGGTAALGPTAGAITETTLPAIPVATEGVGAALGATGAAEAGIGAAEAGMGAAEAAATTGGSIFGSLGVLGPVGLGVGLVGGILALAFPNILEDWFS